MRSSNPALSTDTFRGTLAQSPADQMTIQGTVNKTLVLLLILLVPAYYVWNLFFTMRDPGAINLYMMVGVFGGLVVALVTVFKKTWAPVTAPLYAALEGLALGGISSFFEARFPGIVIQAVGLTFTTLLALLMAYKSGLIKVTENFKLGVAAATGGIFLFYMLQMVLGFFNVRIPYVHEGGIIGIGFSLFVIVIASLNLVMDFDFIEEGARRRAPRYMEWYAAFGLMVTLIWLYLEFLRLLSKLQGSRR
ncbi:Bax inhibitor-1/YccA family protein [Oligoflexus tunisiensis]|uniref:Bax inhibitor-1/YccA family protein n=1 Tax=Oligoflexus tunisiensis TaxID=708132 RepID=UPI00114CC9E9